MQYDLSMICELCAEVGFPCLDAEAGEVTIVLGDGLRLLFRNCSCSVSLNPVSVKPGQGHCCAARS